MERPQISASPVESEGNSSISDLAEHIGGLGDEVLEDSNVHDLAKLVYELIRNSESEEAESL